jgi:hypothetical protein
VTERRRLLREYLTFFAGAPDEVLIAAAARVAGASEAELRRLIRETRALVRDPDAAEAASAAYERPDDGHAQRRAERLAARAIRADRRRRALRWRAAAPRRFARARARRRTRRARRPRVTRAGPGGDGPDHPGPAAPNRRRP